MPDPERRPYTIEITDVTTGKTVILAAVDLTDDQRRALVAEIVRLTGAPPGAWRDE